MRSSRRRYIDLIPCNIFFLSSSHIQSCTYHSHVISFLILQSHPELQSIICFYLQTYSRITNKAAVTILLAVFYTPVISRSGHKPVFTSGLTSLLSHPELQSEFSYTRSYSSVISRAAFTILMLHCF
ncbi:hypothetical protein GDO78_014761 [Eleutherodactylus coqui]|uniref:Uncharacterized protein n=1 Tax=Eleutherodactylus coqui TaxID=57060 RepID=A0A8J6BC30_ELECQ|nr:hypothetical protein GDO78_014761 [Eleutherodactylus coqui]